MSWALYGLAINTIVCIICTQADSMQQADWLRPPSSTKKHLMPDAFAKFMSHFDPVEVFAKVDQIKRTKHLTLAQYTDMIFEGLDSADTLLKVRVQNGNPRVLAASSRRQASIANRYAQTFRPAPGLSIFPQDRFQYRDRLYELMKQAIYQARNKMVIMQLVRRKRWVMKMFKMGYLVGKADTAVKVFNKVSWHVWRHCIEVMKHKSGHYLNFDSYDVMVSHLRMLHLWFQAELITDLVVQNDVAYHWAYAVKGHWNFTD